MDYALTTCPNCGKLIINAENFCPKCGCNIKTINKDGLTINLVDDNDAERIYMIGEDYFYGNNGRIQSDIKAFEQYEKAATFGHTKAIFSKGWMYYYGRGVQQNLTSAFDCFQSAAKKGNMYAQKYVGECYWNGWGVVQDHESAKEWYYKAAIQGEHESEFWVGIYYFNKGYKETAFQWYLKSAESGFRAAQIAVASAYILEQGWLKIIINLSIGMIGF